MATANPMPDPNIYDIREDGTVYGKRSGKLIPIRTSRYGLPQIRFYKGHRYRVQLLSKIIWTHFHGEIPFMHEVRYVDDDPWNCSLENLYLKDLNEEFTPLDRWPGFAISKGGELINMTTLHRIKPMMPPSRTNLMFSVRVDGESRTFPVAFTVWETFMGEKVNSHYLCHKDGNVWNCALDNLYLSDEYPYFPPKGDREDGPKYKPIIEEDGKEYMPVEYYIHMVDGVKGERESGIPQHCRLGSY